MFLYSREDTVGVTPSPPSMCDEKDVSQLCRIKSMENGLLGIILKSLFSIDVQTYFLFFAANSSFAVMDFRMQIKFASATSQ